MSKTITAIFDGKVLQPEKPLDLKPNQRYTITITNDELVRSRSAGVSPIENQINSLPEQNHVRNHKSFLNGYAPEDEGLYDDY